jgi:multicomponent Na+:H+ antiporter subunit F
MTIAVAISASFLAAGMLLALIRLGRGPSLPDRIVALEHMSILAIAVIAVWVIATGETPPLDLAIVIALIGFLATVALARYLESREAARHHGVAPGDQSPDVPPRMGSWPERKTSEGRDE